MSKRGSWGYGEAKKFVARICGTRRSWSLQCAWPVRHDLRELHRRLSYHRCVMARGGGEAVDFLDDSPTLRLENLDLASDDQLAAARIVLSPFQRASVSRPGAGGTS